MAKVNPVGLAELRRRLTGVALAGAQQGAAVLQGKLAGPGSGTHHPGLPNRSSAAGEYPAEQTSALHDSIDARVIGTGQALFGPIDNPPDYLPALLGKPPDMGGRPFLDDAKFDRQIHTAILDGVEEEAQRVFSRARVRRRT